MLPLSLAEQRVTCIGVTTWGELGKWPVLGYVKSRSGGHCRRLMRGVVRPGMPTARDCGDRCREAEADPGQPRSAAGSQAGKVWGLSADVGFVT